MDFKSIKDKYIALYHECLSFIIDPNVVWDRVENVRRTWTDTQTRILYPFLALICACGLIRVLFENFYISGYDLITQILLALAWPVLLAISLVINAVILRPLLQLYTGKTVDFERMVVFLTYAEIPLFISAVLFAFLPMLFGVLIFANFYSAYVIMSGYNVYFADVMGEERKYNFLTTLVTFVMIYLLTYGAWWALTEF